MKKKTAAEEHRETFSSLPKSMNITPPFKRTFIKNKKAVTKWSRALYNEHGKWLHVKCFTSRKAAYDCEDINVLLDEYNLVSNSNDVCPPKGGDES